MKRDLKFEVTVNYEWEPKTGEDVPDRHQEALTEDAERQIYSDIQKGMIRGTLSTGVRISDEDGEGGIEYIGWWESDINFSIQT